MWSQEHLQSARQAAASGPSDQTSDQKGTDAVLSPEAASLLTSYAWPGNLTQLENLCLRLACLPELPLIPEQLAAQLDDSRYYQHLGPTASTALAPAALTTAALTAGVPTTAASLTGKPEGFFIHNRLVTYDELRAMDRYYQGKKSLIAEKLGVSRSTLWRYYRTMDGEDTT